MLLQVHRKVSNRKNAKRKYALRVANWRTNVLTLNICMCDYATVRMHCKGRYRLQAKQRGSRNVMEAGLNLVFEGEDINDA